MARNEITALQRRLRRLVRRWSAWAWKPEAEVAEGVEWLAENGASLRCVPLGPFIQGYVVIGDDGKTCGDSYTPESALKEAMKAANIGNAMRRSECLAEVEYHHTSLEPGDDGEMVEECPLRWADSPTQYRARYEALMDTENETNPATGSK